MRRAWKGIAFASVAMLLLASNTLAAPTFTPAVGYSATEVWSGANAAHFAIAGDDLFIYGAEDVGGGQYENVVRLYDGATTVEIARSPAYAGDEYFADAITVVDGAVYWAHAQSYMSGSAANVYKTTYDAGTWQTTQVLDESAGINVYSLSTNGTDVLGTGLSAAGTNVAFYLDDADNYEVLAELPAGAAGGSGCDPAGNFFAGAWSVGGDYANHMYQFSAQQVTARLAGTQAGPYAAGDAQADLLVAGNASTVMESDGAYLYGTQYNAMWTGTEPFAYDLAAGTTTALGTLSGADTTVATDLYARAGSVYFLAKDSWSSGSARIYQVVPEPTALILLATAVMLRRRWSM